MTEKGKERRDREGAELGETGRTQQWLKPGRADETQTGHSQGRRKTTACGCPVFPRARSRPHSYFQDPTECKFKAIWEIRKVWEGGGPEGKRSGIPNAPARGPAGHFLGADGGAAPQHLQREPRSRSSGEARARRWGVPGSCARSPLRHLRDVY